MNCDRVRGQLAEYSAGFLQGQERVRVRDHLTTCEACQAELSEFRALDDLLGADRAVGDEELVQGVMAQVRVLHVRRRPLWIAIAEQAGPLVAMAAVVVLVGLLALSGVGRLLPLESAGDAPFTWLLTVAAVAAGTMGVTAIAWLMAREVDVVA